MVAIVLAFLVCFYEAAIRCVAVSVMPSKEIAPGVHMPVISLGTGGPDIHTDVSNFTKVWLKNGFRAIDTAWMYGTQPYIAEAITDTGVDRSQLFITSKVPDTSGYNATVKSIQDSLKQLSTDYIDLLLIHFPTYMPGSTDLAETWRAMEDAVDQKKVLAIGVSNFKEVDLTELLKTAKVVPALNQNMHNVLSHDDALISFCARHGIAYEAYQPLGRGFSYLLDNPTIISIGLTHNVSAAQVAIRWIVQQGHTLACEAGTEKHQLEDTDVFSWSLSKTEVATLDQLMNQTTMTTALV